MSFFFCYGSYILPVDFGLLKCGTFFFLRDLYLVPISQKGLCRVGSRKGRRCSEWFCSKGTILYLMAGCPPRYWAHSMSWNNSEGTTVQCCEVIPCWLRAEDIPAWFSEQCSSIRLTLEVTRSPRILQISCRSSYLLQRLPSW